MGQYSTSGVEEGWNDGYMQWEKSTHSSADCHRLANVHRLPEAQQSYSKRSFPLPFIDEMLERLASHSFFCYLEWREKAYHSAKLYKERTKRWHDKWVRTKQFELGDKVLSYPVLRPKPSTHSMCAQESNLHAYRTENGYRITNVTIEYIYYWIMSHKRLNRSLSKIQQRKDSITPQEIDRGNRSSRTPHQSAPTVLHPLSSKWARLSTLMVGTQQVQEIMICRI
jgi:hypothetical protein